MTSKTSERHLPDGQSTFRLTPQESFHRGVSVDGTTLRIRCSGTELAEASIGLLGAALAGLFTVLMATGEPTTVNGIIIDRPLPMAALAIATVATFVWTSVSTLRTELVATPDGLKIRSRECHDEYPWSEIAEITASNTPENKWSTRIGTIGFTARRNWISSYSTGTAILIDGTAVSLPGLHSAARGEGLNLGAETPTELKVATLRRYRLEVVGPWPERLPDAPPARAATHRSFLAKASWAVGAPLTLWGGLELSSSETVGSGPLVFMLTLSLMVVGWTTWRNSRSASTSPPRPSRSSSP